MSLIETYKEKMILPPERELAGKTFSILGDGTSTFSGTYNGVLYKNYYDTDGVYSSTGSPLPVTYYPTTSGGLPKTDKVWWHFLIDEMKMEFKRNNSCVERRVSSTALSNTPFRKISGITTHYISIAGYKQNEIEILKDSTDPNYIFVQLGLIDFLNEVPLGDYDGSIFLEKLNNEGDTAFENFSFAYATMLDKMTEIYPTSKIYCMTCYLHDANPPGEGHPEWPASGEYPELNGPPLYLSIKVYNERIKTLAKAFGVRIIDLENCGINYYNLSQTMDDYTSIPRGIMPNELGQELIYQAVRKALLYD